MKNAIILHVYYNDLWQEFADKLKVLTPNFDLYVTLIDEHEDITDSIRRDFPNAVIFRLQNRGTDVGPFLYVLNYIFKKNLDYNLIYKLHTKKSILHGTGTKGDLWRRYLVDCMIGTNERYDIINTTMEKEVNIGMCGSYDFLTKQMDIKWFIDLLIELGVGNNHDKLFIAGTMFIVRFDIYKKFFSNIDLMQIYNNEMPYGYSENWSIMHKFERIFGFIVLDNGYSILGLKNIDYDKV